MPCIVLKRPDGTTRKIPYGMNYIKHPGEEPVGIDRDCPDGPRQFSGHGAVSEKKQLLRELDEEIGSGAGDWIKRFVAPVAKKLGKQSCTACEARRVVTNAYARLKAKHGQLEALRIIKDLWKNSFSKTGEEILEELEKHLHD
jgi:hypothetical protein